MRYSYEVAAGALACTAAICAVSLAMRWWRVRRPTRFCPGPRTSGAARLNPWRWFVRHGCGYELTGLRSAEDGSIICPECARHIPSVARGRTSRARVRWAFLALTLMAVSTATLLAPIVRTGDWASHAPNWLVVAHRVVLGKHGLHVLNSQANSRFWNAKLTPGQIDWIIPSYIDDLRNDDIRWNGETAIDVLDQIGLRAVPRLEAALTSRDYQQRQFAAHILRGIYEAHPRAYTPSDALLAATAEGLNSDSLPYEPSPTPGGYGAYSGISNAVEGYEFFSRLGPRGASYLGAAMRTGDAQAKLFAAGAAARAELLDLLPQAAPILVEHLKNNEVEGDARFACSSLALFGPEVIPYLAPGVRSDDPQQRKTSLLIALDLASDSDDSVALRSQLQCISGYLDPPRAGADAGLVRIP